MKFLIVGGNFDKDGGSPSKIISMLYQEIEDYIADSYSHNFSLIELVNGSTVDYLRNIDFTKYDVLFWAPNISNDEEKIIPGIKQMNPKLFMISSKRVVEKQYQESDIIGRLLKTKSNLGVMITKKDQYNFQVLDPLGNQYCNTTSIESLSKAIVDRLMFVKGLNRVRSIKVGDKRDISINPEFLEFVKHSATEFTKYVNAINPNRLLGNASTRCMFGFPAEKNDGRIFVTQRNIDKQLIENEGFVEVNNREDVVEYYGDKKPSVDTPIQIKLFNYYSNINYMVHGHVYIDGAQITDSKIPCGYVEEFDEIVALYPSRDESLVVVNLRGHGCLIMAATVEQLWDFSERYKSREFPEE